MFQICFSLTSFPDLSKWDTSHLDDYEDMFRGCNKEIKKPKLIKKKWILFG